MTEKLPGWVERLLIPTLESRVRSIVKEEIGHLEKTFDTRFEMVESKFEAMESKLEAMDTKLDAIDAKFGAKFDAVGAAMDSLEKRIPIIQDIADIKARLAIVEKRDSTR